jgi:hypothetical protein
MLRLAGRLLISCRPCWHLQAGDLARLYGHRLTFHPSEFCKIAGDRPNWTEVRSARERRGRAGGGLVAWMGAAAAWPQRLCGVAGSSDNSRL